VGIAEHNWGESEAADEVWKLVVGIDPSIAGDCLAVSLVAYIDDSRDPHGGTLVLGGHVATVENWAKLSAEWAPMLPRFATLNKQGHYEFKMSEMMRTPERIANIQPFYRLIEKYVLASISVCITARDVAMAIARTQVPKCKIDWTHFRNPHMFAYRALMDMFHARRAEFTPNVFGNEIVDFIFDEQSESRMIHAAWDRYMESRDSNAGPLFGQMPVFRSSEKYMPLQAADMWAGWVRICENRGNRQGINPPDFGSWKGKEGSRFAYHGVWNEDQITHDLKSLVGPLLAPRQPVYDVKIHF
jgi:hypothetical protein